MRAKLELLAAMRIVAEQTEPHSAFREVADAICAVLRQGKPFSEALSKFPKHFSPLFVSIVKAGETSGGLSDALTQINAYLTRQEAMRRKVFSALAYPVILLFVGAGSIVVLMTVVIPKLKPIFATMGGKIPLVTKIILAASDLSRDGALAIALAFVLAVYALYTQRSSAWFTHLTHTLKRRMPLVSGLVCDQEYAHLSRSLGMLIRSRVSVLQALSVARHTVSDPRLSRGLEAVCDAVGAGESLAKSLERMTDLPPFFVKMVAVGEESGRLGEVLDEVTATYTDQVEGHIAVLSSMLEPLMILCMGTILGGIVLSVLIPMFQLTQAVG
jgi:type II secretory pathway component PulF